MAPSAGRSSMGSDDRPHGDRRLGEGDFLTDVYGGINNGQKERIH